MDPGVRVAYFYQGWTGRANRGVLALAAWGKGVFAGLLLAESASGEVLPFAGVAAVPDLALAVVFAVWLWRSSGRPSHAESGGAADGGV